jgi:peptidoglycan/xylan/chitin deacetylase (PgdA/CDA1 family)
MFLLPLPILLVSFFLISQFALFFGDIELTRDKIASSQALFKLGQIVNPFNSKLSQRVTATESLLTERMGKESEETTDPKVIADNPSKSYVLGKSIQIPVLMYHYIRINPWETDKVGFNLSVTPYDFAMQMDYLLEHGYHTISLDELGANLLFGAKLPIKPIVLSFDDGYRDFFTNAFPILQKRNMKAVNFVITGFVGLPVYLTWEEISQMEKSGLVTFGAHTVDHSGLTSLPDKKILWEMTQSKKDLEEHLGYPINWIAYPYGDVNEHVASLAKQVGFVGAFGTKLGTFESTDNLFTQPRVRVGGGESAEELGTLLPWR